MVGNGLVAFDELAKEPLAQAKLSGERRYPARAGRSRGYDTPSLVHTDPPIPPGDSMRLKA